MGTFLSNLVGGYSQAILAKEDRDYQKQREDKAARISVLKEAIASGRLTPEAQDAAFSQLEELTSGKGKKKGGMGIKDILGRLTGRIPKQEHESLEETMRRLKSGQTPPFVGNSREGEKPQPSGGMSPSTPAGGMEALPGRESQTYPSPQGPIPIEPEPDPMTGRVPGQRSGGLPALASQGMEELPLAKPGQARIEPIPLGKGAPGKGAVQLEALPQRPKVFKTAQDIAQEDINAKKAQFEQVEKPELDYRHKLIMEEIEKQYGSKLTPRNKILGSSVPLPNDANGNPIDPSKPYTVLYDNQNRPVAAMAEYEKPASGRATGPEAKIESMAKNLEAEANSKGHPITHDEAVSGARRMALVEARQLMASRLETIRGKQFANKVKDDLAKGAMSPATARAVIGYAATEAKRRANDDPQTIQDMMTSVKSIQQVEDDIYRELGTTRHEVSGFLRQGSKPASSSNGNGASGAGKKKMKFDANIVPK